MPCAIYSKIRGRLESHGMSHFLQDFGKFIKSLHPTS